MQTGDRNSASLWDMAQVSSEVIWNIVTSVLPSLLVEVEALLPPLPDDS